MLSFSRCKINLGLYVTGKRNDGYHSIDSVFYPVPIRDALEIIPSKKTSIGKYYFECRGIELNTAPGTNLCEKAFTLLQQEFDVPPTEIYLQKNIPAGAGLGGGSANAAKTLEMLNELYQLHISKRGLAERAIQLGSDCAFFIYNTPCQVTGRGENIEPINFSLRGYTLVLINPGIHISTAEAYTGVKAVDRNIHAAEIIKTEPVSTWKNTLHNDFEKVVFKKHPAIEKIKTDLYTQGAVYASMSGSGSSVYGIFKTGTEKTDTIKSSFSGYRIFITALE